MICSNDIVAKGQWFKGNLHTHTTNSDGKLSVEQLANSYKGRGYDFLAITDHAKVSGVDEYSISDFLLLNGVEICGGCSEIGELYHITVVGLKETVKVMNKLTNKLAKEISMEDLQEMIDLTRTQGGIAWLAHPYWSGLTLKDIVALKRILAIEVFNISCSNIGKEFSTVHWDNLLAHGTGLYGFAVDDAHYHDDIGQGWIMVKAESLSMGNILSAIKEGHFYSTCGPLIEDVSLKDSRVVVNCSEAVKINFICDGPHGASIVSDEAKFMVKATYKLSDQERYLRIDRSSAASILSDDERFITKAAYKLSDQQKYLRVEVIDSQGKSAWSQPILCE